MQNFIESIVEQFGGRYYGSKEEKAAQEYVQKSLEEFCDTTEIRSFESALGAHFEALKIFVVVHLFLIFLMPFNYLLTMGLALLNSLLFIGHFVTYRHCLDFLFPKKTSYNVIGEVLPELEIKQSIIFAGHIDSVKEFKWWYKLKDFGIALTVIASFSLALFGVFSVFAFFFQNSLATSIIWWVFVIISPSLLVLFDMHGQEVVHGVNDNLTGVALSFELGKYFSKNRLKHTKIKVISFGAEEAGLRGAFAYAKENKALLLKENSLLVNVDTIKDLEHLCIATNELNTLSFFDKGLIAKLKQSFDAKGVSVKTLPLTVGASDASAFMMNGLPALSLIGMTTEKLDPTYHTRLDNLDNFDPKALEKLKEVLIHFVEEIDSKQ
ncbi:MAG: M20/M25/M40 family metallo-hydrolase [Chitinophagales bacterium]|nr:M20/M25/M40 family metallo-hydrolase [Chitinophagales bacterium]